MRRNTPLPPPPTVDELRFQEFQFDDRIQRRTSGMETPLYSNNLGAAFFGSHGRDMSIAGQLRDVLADAGEVLR